MVSFVAWKTLTPNDQVNFPQQIGFDAAKNIYLTQSEDSGSGYENLTISKFTAAGSYVAKMTGLRGHGTPLKVEDSGGDVYLTFPYKDATGGDQWVRLPWSNGRVWTKPEALALPTNDLPSYEPKKPYWGQGDVEYGGTVYRLVGGPFNNSGPTKDGPAAYIQTIKSGKVVGTIPANHLGRVGMVASGAPINARLEPEGLAVLVGADKSVNLVVGIANGRADNDTLLMSLYLYQIVAAPVVVVAPNPPSRDVFGLSYTTKPPAPVAQFVVCDTLTGDIVGSVQPNKWELTEPLNEPGTGLLTIPYDDASYLTLKNLLQPRSRYLVVQDANDNCVWTGPILKNPWVVSQVEISVPLIDWRGYFWRVLHRPKEGSVNGPSVYKNVEQGTILRDMLRRQQDSTLTPPYYARPCFTWDNALVTGVSRDLTTGTLDKSIGEWAQEFSNRERGIEWWVDGVVADETRIMPQVRFAYPERRFRPDVIRIEYRKDIGGNVYDVSWPEPDEQFTRVWAVGDGEPPAQVVTKDQFPELTQGGEVLWEKLVGPLSGVTKKATAFEYAYAEIQTARRVGGQAEVTMTEDRLFLSAYKTGDRARVVMFDGFNDYDIPAARIINRVLSGGRGAPTIARLTLDLLDAHAPGDGSDPGEAVTVDVTA